MKNIQSFDDFVNESCNEQEEINEAKVDGKNMGPETDKSMFASKVKSIDDLKVGSEYILLEYGMNVWLGDWAYDGVSGSKKDTYTFSSTLQFNDQVMDYSKSELEAAIKDGDIYSQK